MEKRGPYKGANKSSRDDARKGSARKPDTIRAAGKTPASRAHSVTGYPDLDKRFRREAADRAALSRVVILAGDEVALGCNSSGWSAFTDVLRGKMRVLDAGKIDQADRIAAIWNKDGFKTGAGQRWTARLVEVAKIKLAAAEPVTPTH